MNIRHTSTHNARHFNLYGIDYVLIKTTNDDDDDDVVHFPCIALHTFIL